MSLTRVLKDQTTAIAELVRGGATPNAALSAIDTALRNANQRFNAAADGITGRMINGMDRTNKQRIERALQRALGVDTATIIDGDDIRQVIEASTAENVSLIRTIPEEHFRRVSQAVFANYRGEEFVEGSLSNRLKKVGGISDRRAKFIARDQTAKFVSALNEERQKDAGIDGYIWRNSQDNRVVGNPAGKYPEGTRQHRNHWDREGKFYRWDSPPADGHPGQPIGCRCFSEPVVNVDKVNADAIRV